ncbi:MAG: hypothetical protein QGG09_16905, partial [Pirellulaceae bacterium]|nr:hypothetical protein [Pirellulaceae bacterium]
PSHENSRSFRSQRCQSLLPLFDSPLLVFSEQEREAYRNVDSLAIEPPISFLATPHHVLSWYDAPNAVT